MNFRSLHRKNLDSGNFERYFRLRKSFRDADGTVRSRNVLTIGFDMNDISLDDVWLVAQGLTALRNLHGNREILLGDVLSEISATRARLHREVLG